MTADEPCSGHDEPEGADLIRASAEAGCEISDRMLESFRAQGLIPRPRRTGYRGRAPVWQYPAGTGRQLAALLRWRQQSKDPDLLKVLLWLDGFPIPPSAARDALSRQLQAMTQTMEQAISQQARRLNLDPADGAARDQAIDTLAQTLSAKRGTAPIPRRSRVTAGERARAMALILRMFGMGQTVEGTAAEADAIERVMGIAPKGRRNSIGDSEPWLTGPAEDLFGAAGIVALPNLLSTVAGSSDADLTAARQFTISLLRYLPLMVRVIGAMFDDENYIGLAFFSQMDQNPEFVLFVIPMMLAMLKAGWTENIRAVTTALDQAPAMASQMQRVLSLPSATVTANLAGQSEEVRQQTQRLIDAAIDGRLDLDSTR